MLRQHKADSELISIYGKVLALIILLIVLSYLGFHYFGSIKQVGQQSVRVEHTRLLNVLGVVRSQWLMRSKPEVLQLDWYSDSEEHITSTGQVRMAVGGWPILDETSVAGCQQLLSELLGKSYALQIDTEFNVYTGVCRYIGESGDSISYQTTSGRVIFLTKAD